jgi:hypothetical protein
MFQGRVNLALFMTIVLGLSACASVEQKMIDAGATRLNGVQASSRIVGNTERWPEGGAYYNSNGTVEVIWEGAELSGPYTVWNDGSVCYTISNWKMHCHHYMNEKGAVVMMYQGKNLGVRKIMTGNKLSQL